MLSCTHLLPALLYVDPITQAAELPPRVLKVDQGKGGKDREVVITDDMYSALSRYSSFRDKIMSTSSLLFCSTRGMKLHCADFHIIFRKISSEMGKRFTPHDLRRTYASTLSRLGVPPFMIQLQMGHTDIRTTMHYVTHNIDDAKKAISRLSLSG